MLVVDPTFRPTINQVQEHLASLSASAGFDINAAGGAEGTELDLELSSLNSANLIQESASNESLQSSASITTTSEVPVSVLITSIIIGLYYGFVQIIHTNAKNFKVFIFLPSLIDLRR